MFTTKLHSWIREWPESVTRKLLMKQAHAALQQAHKAFGNIPSAYHWRALEAAMLTYQAAYQAAQDAREAAYDDAEIAAWNSDSGRPVGSEY